jgi:hypothetical protein
MRKRFYIFLSLYLIGYLLPAFEGEYGGRLDFLLSYKKIGSGEINRLFPQLLSEPLCRLNADGTPYSNIFKSFAFDEETLTLTLELNEDLKWSDGSAIMADEIYGALGGFIKNARNDGFVAAEGETPPAVFQPPIIKIMLQKSPDPLFYYLMSKMPLEDSSGKNRWTGPFAPQQPSADGSLSLLGNIYSLSGRPFLDEVVFRPAKYDRMGASLLSVPCGGADFDLIPPAYCEGEENEFSIKGKDVIFLLSIGEGIPVQHRIRIAALIKSFDFIKGIAKGNAARVEEFPLPGREVESEAQPVINASGKPAVEPPEQGGLNTASCPLIEIQYSSDSLFLSLTERISAILQSAGYQAVKRPLEGNRKSGWDVESGNVIFITSINIGENENEPWFTGIFELMDLCGQLSFPDLTKNYSPDTGVFRIAEKRLLESGRLLYLFQGQMFRVFTCNISGEGGFENYSITRPQD